MKLDSLIFYGLWLAILVLVAFVVQKCLAPL